jgi:hypothetical protein
LKKKILKEENMRKQSDKLKASHLSKEKCKRQRDRERERVKKSQTQHEMKIYVTYSLPTV